MVRGTNSEFTKVANGVPVTVLKNCKLAYFIISVHGYRKLREAEKQLENLEVRYEAGRGIDEKFNNVEDLMAYLND